MEYGVLRMKYAFAFTAPSGCGLGQPYMFT